MDRHTPKDTEVGGAVKSSFATRIILGFRMKQAPPNTRMHARAHTRTHVHTHESSAGSSSTKVRPAVWLAGLGTLWQHKLPWKLTQNFRNKIKERTKILYFLPINEKVTKTPHSDSSRWKMAFSLEASFSAAHCLVLCCPHLSPSPLTGASQPTSGEAGNTAVPGGRGGAGAASGPFHGAKWEGNGNQRQRLSCPGASREAAGEGGEGWV